MPVVVVLPCVPATAISVCWWRWPQEVLALDDRDAGRLRHGRPQGYPPAPPRRSRPVQHPPPCAGACPTKAVAPGLRNSARVALSCRSEPRHGILVVKEPGQWPPGRCRQCRSDGAEAGFYPAAITSQVRQALRSFVGMGTLLPHPQDDQEQQDRHQQRGWQRWGQVGRAGLGELRQLRGVEYALGQRIFVQGHVMPQRPGHQDAVDKSGTQCRKTGRSCRATVGP